MKIETMAQLRKAVNDEMDIWDANGNNGEPQDLSEFVFPGTAKKIRRLTGCELKKLKMMRRKIPNNVIFQWGRDSRGTLNQQEEQPVIPNIYDKCPLPDGFEVEVWYSPSETAVLVMPKDLHRWEGVIAFQFTGRIVD